MDKEQILKGIEEFQVRKNVEAKIIKAGFPIPTKPADIEGQRNLFEEWDSMKTSYGGISNIPFPLLGEYLDRWTQLVSYARWVEAIADIDQASAREVRDFVKKQLYTLMEGNRELRDASVYIEPSVVQLQRDYMEKYSLWNMIKALREGYEQRANTISREITRRSNDLNDSNRSYNRGYTP